MFNPCGISGAGVEHCAILMNRIQYIAEGSHTFVESLISDPHTLSIAQTAKGWLFVAATAVLLYLLVRHYMQALVKNEGARKEMIEGTSGSTGSWAAIQSR